MAINFFGASSGFGWQPVQMDLSSLIQPIDTTTVLAMQAAKKFNTPAVIAPWADQKKQSSTSELVSRALASKTIIDPQAPGLRDAKSNKDLNSLFSMYRALDTLKALADQAASKTTSAVMRDKLNARFEKGMEELRAYVSSSQGEHLQMLFGEKKSQLETVAVPKTPRVVNGTGMVADSPSIAIPGLKGDETFTIELKTSTRSDTFTINLAEITGTKSLGGIAGLINKKISEKVALDADGNPRLNKDGEPILVYNTKAEVYVAENGKWGIRFNGSSAEQITLKDPAAKPSLYVVTGNQKNGASAISGLKRIDDVTGALTPGAGETTVAGIDTEATRLAQKLALADPKKKTTEAEAKAITVNAPTTARSSAVDSQGFVYVVGSSSGDFGTQQGSGENDLFLTKYAPDGSVVYSRLIGAGSTTEGYSVAVDKDDNVIVAGSTTASLTSGDAFSGQDSFVTRFAADGTEQFTVQLDRMSVDAATAITTDDSGNIYIAGKVKGTIAAGATGAGGEDIFVAKIDGGKRVVEGIPTRLLSVTQFGTAGNDSVADIAVGPDGSLLIAGTESGRAVIRKLDTADLKTELSKVDLGDLGGGSVTGIAVDEKTGTIAVVGSTTKDTLSAGPATGAFGGATDGFLARLDSTLASQGVTYLGTAGTDKINDVVAHDGEFYVTGSTSGVLAGTGKKGSVDAFVSRLDAATGAVEAKTQFGNLETATSGTSLVFNATGHSNTLSKIGLHSGVLNPKQSTDVLSQTSLRPGDHFFISVGSSTRKVTIEQGDTFDRLAKKIRSMFPLDLTVTVSNLSAGSKLQFKAKSDKEITFKAGKDGHDALEKLGMEPAKLLTAEALYGKLSDSKKKNDTEDALKPGGSFALGLDMSLSLADSKAASYTSGVINGALETVKRAYRSLYFDESKAQMATQAKFAGDVPAHLNKQLANYQEALRRLGGG